jgi:hypothetical protein
VTFDPQNTYTIALKRDADFWQDELTITDEAEALVTLASAELIIHPSETTLAPVVWNVGNGKLELPSPGVIRFSLTIEDIATYTWSSGRYCLSIVYTNSKRDRSLIRGPVKIAKAC